MATTHNFNITEILETQSQKATTANEAFHILDSVAGGYVQGISALPSSAVSNGDVWVIAVNASGIWAGRDNQLALRITDSWRYVSAKTGMTFLNNQTNSFIKFTGSEWTDVLESGVTQVNVSGNLSIATSGTSIDLSSPNNIVPSGDAGNSFSGNVLQVWVGTSTAFAAIASASPTTLYLIGD